MDYLQYFPGLRMNYSRKISQCCWRNLNTVSHNTCYPHYPSHRLLNTVPHFVTAYYVRDQDSYCTYPSSGNTACVGRERVRGGGGYLFSWVPYKGLFLSFGLPVYQGIFVINFFSFKHYTTDNSENRIVINCIACRVASGALCNGRGNFYIAMSRQRHSCDPNFTEFLYLNSRAEYSTFLYVYKYLQYE